MDEIKTFCTECGPNVSFDEDGCCMSCGGLCIGDGVKFVEDLRQENEKLHEQLAQKLVDQAFINDIAVKNGSLHMQMEGGLLNIMADSFASMIMESGAENYLECSFGSKQFLPDEMLLLTIQRCKGETPHQLRTLAESRLQQISEAKEDCFQDIISHMHINESGMISFEHRVYQRFYEKIKSILEALVDE